MLLPISKLKNVFVKMKRTRQLLPLHRIKQNLRQLMLATLNSHPHHPKRSRWRLAKKWLRSRANRRRNRRKNINLTINTERSIIKSLTKKTRKMRNPREKSKKKIARPKLTHKKRNLRLHQRRMREYRQMSNLETQILWLRLSSK